MRDKKEDLLGCVLIRKHSPFSKSFVAALRCFFLRYTK